MEATGELQNPKEVLSKTEYKRYKDALNSFDKPILIVTDEMKDDYGNKVIRWVD